MYPNFNAFDAPVPAWPLDIGSDTIVGAEFEATLMCGYYIPVADPLAIGYRPWWPYPLDAPDAAARQIDVRHGVRVPGHAQMETIYGIMSSDFVDGDGGPWPEDLEPPVLGE